MGSEQAEKESAAHRQAYHPPDEAGRLPPAQDLKKRTACPLGERPRLAPKGMENKFAMV